MDVKVGVLFLCLVLGSMGRPQPKKPESCSAGIISMRTQQKLANQKIDELDNKLDRILKVLEHMDMDVVHDSMCGQALCNGQGNCSLAEDMTGFTCVCEEGFAGERCELSGPCSLAWMEYTFSHPMPGMDEPNCDEEGYFAPVQFRGSQAICVDKHGDWLGYGVPRWMAKPEMSCDCAVEEGENCGKDGSYDTPDYYGHYDRVDSSSQDSSEDSSEDYGYNYYG